jgi:hypothetical protein
MLLDRAGCKIAVARAGARISGQRGLGGAPFQSGLTTLEARRL